MGTQWARQESKKNELADIVESGVLWTRVHPQVLTWAGVGIVAAIIFGAAMINRSLTTKEETWSRFGIAQSYAYAGQTATALDQIKTLNEQYPGSPAAGFGTLLSADIFFQQKNYEEALKTYQSIAQDPAAQKAVLPLARAGITLTLEAKGDSKAAAESAQSYLDQHQDHFLAPQVHAALARCLAAAGDKDKSRATFERIEFLYPNTYWADWAKSQKAL
ncbi:MAG: hypothetical protein A2X36_00340 [Elusimicrobia bacterium GWA2_69_24]|nr:MAG: hypothetical protein A2X36_00340 [Elusimicrobia bacterium GWA2_69_24]HBL16759.1 hypothetical protein [Elusimicrobiota bacterium]